MSYKQRMRKRTDANLKEDAIDALFENFHVDSGNIQVNVVDGVVSLDGSVESLEESREAQSCVFRLIGVVEVINNLKIEKKPSGPLADIGFESGLS